MIKRSFLYICVVMAAHCLLLSCIWDRDHSPDNSGQTDELTVTTAQAAFQELAPDLTLAAVRQDPEIPVMVLWDYSIKYRLGDVQTIQASFNVPPTYSYVQGSSDSLFHCIIDNTVTYLLAEKEDGKAGVDYRVIRFIADDDWLMDKPTKLFRLSLESMDGYTGKILYYDTRGRLQEGAAYVGGEQTGRIGPGQRSIAATRGDGRYCERLIISSMTRDIVLDEVVVIGERPTLYPCIDDNGGSGGSGGGSGGGSSGGGGITSPTNPGQSLEYRQKMEAIYNKFIEILGDKIKNIKGKIVLVIGEGIAPGNVAQLKHMRTDLFDTSAPVIELMIEDNGYRVDDRG